MIKTCEQCEEKKSVTRFRSIYICADCEEHLSYAEALDRGKNPDYMPDNEMMEAYDY